MLKTLGGERLGAGKQLKIGLHNYERSTFNLSRVWRSTMNVGTLIPFLTEVGLNGDTFDIDLSAMIRTVPTQGPLFGSYKLQLDVFGTPIRLYNGLLHNNALNIGMDMSRVKMPTIDLYQYLRYDANRQPYEQKTTKWSDTCLSAFFNKRGIADVVNYDTINGTQKNNILSEETNALPYLVYADIYKHYYANKQEKNGKLIGGTIKEHKYFKSSADTYTNYDLVVREAGRDKWHYLEGEYTGDNTIYIGEILFTIEKSIETSAEKWEKLKRQNKTNTILSRDERELFSIEIDNNGVIIVPRTSGATCTPATLKQVEQYELMSSNNIKENEVLMTCSGFSFGVSEGEAIGVTTDNPFIKEKATLEIIDFPLTNIDDMKVSILRATDFDQAININDQSELPYSINSKVFYENEETPVSTEIIGTANEMEFNGIFLKTYQSDVFNNWLQKEWVDNIATISSVATTTGSFTMDSLNLAKKIYNMLNRVAVSGGTYEDWQEAIWGEEAIRRAESPIYYGGANSEIVFEEVISNSASEDEPLGTIAGRGNLNKFQNGHIVIKCEEPMIIMGIVSITPRLDYDSNSNWWMEELKTLNDLHKPALDGIGFQDLLAYNATYKVSTPTIQRGGQAHDNNKKLAIGKQPAWLYYQTAVNEVHGEFCDKNKTGWMVLTRDYDVKLDSSGNVVGDFTTYIDPKKYNYPFAYKELDAQNFWCQIGVSITARRKMSAKQMPNV